MKKYITLAALLAAGTSFANADVLTTTFGNANQADATKVTLSVAGLEGVSATIDSLVQTQSPSTSVGIMSTGGTAAADLAIFTPNTNVGNGSPWTAEFTYTFDGGVEVLALNSITLDVVLFASGGGYQGPQASWNGGVTFTATILNGTDELGVFASTLAPGHGQDSTPFTLTLTPTAGIDLSTVETYTVKLALTEDLSAGCFVGLKEIRQEVSVVPEPSAFGLLAGLGALALTASRRRRK